MLKLGPFRGGIIRTIHEPQICLTTKHSGFVADFAPFFIQVQNMLCNVNEGLLVVISLPQVLAFQKKMFCKYVSSPPAHTSSYRHEHFRTFHQLCICAGSCPMAQLWLGLECLRKSALAKIQL